MMKYILLAVFIILGVGLFAQTNHGIQKAYAFSSQRMPGNIPVDENGNALNTGPLIQRYVVIETKGKVVPVWKNATINGKSYSVITQPVATPTLQVGRQKYPEQMIILKPARGNKLWHLELVPVDDNNSSINRNNLTSEVILNGKYAGKEFKYKIGRPVELEALPSY